MSTITPSLVTLDADFGVTPQDVIGQLAKTVAAAGRSTNAALLTEDACAREAKSATGVPGGVVIPHCRTAASRLGGSGRW